MHRPSDVQTSNPSRPRASLRARCARFATRIVARLEGSRARRLQVIDVSLSGLLAAIEGGPPPPLRYAVQLTVATPDDLQLTMMAVVARHTTVDGVPALGLKLFPLDRAREALWASIVEKAAREPPPVRGDVAAFKDGDPLDELDITVEDLVDLEVALELDRADDDEDLLFIEELH